MSTTPAGAQPVSEIVKDWVKTDMPLWVFVFKTCVSALLALWLAFRLGFDQPRTAMTTVFIVAQPQTGLILAKSFYRVIGTLVGLVVTIALVGMFAQSQELFLLTISLWIGLCVAGAAWFRDFQAYAFVLAGYTTCMIGFPAVMQPGAVFQVAVTRASEILLGIGCVALISDAVLPQRLGPKLVQTVRGQFSHFVGFMRHAVEAPLDRTVTPADQLRFVSDVLTLESLRASTLFEDPESRVRSDRLRLFNADFMKVSTTLHALQQLARRMRQTGQRTQALALLRPHVDAFGPALLYQGEPPAMAAEAGDVARQIAEYRPLLRRRLREDRAHLATQVSPEELLDFDCAAELLEDLVAELHTFTATYASLAHPRHTTDRKAPSLVLHTQPSDALTSGFRATAAMLVLTAFWIISAWPNGASAATIACVGCALFAASPTPTRSIRQMGTGFLVGLVAAYICSFHILTQVDGFVLMGAGMLPFMMLGVWLMAHPQTAGIGAGFNIMFTSAMSPENVMRFNAVSFLNDGIAQLVGLAVAAVAFSLLAHKSPLAVCESIAKRLRRELVRACEDPLRHLPHAFDGRTRDLMRRLMGLPAESRDQLLSCALSVLEVGDAVVDLRLISAKHLPSRLHEALRETLQVLTRGFERPTAASREASLKAVEKLMQDLAAAAHYQVHSGNERETMERVNRCLHRIYSVLGDDAWFAAFTGEFLKMLEEEAGNAA